MDFIYSIIGFLLAISILVAVHEFGHYWVAKKLGVKVLRYSIGFGKPLFSTVRGRDKTEYVIASIPLGGYVKMLDEAEGPVASSESHRAFNRQPIWKRSLIVVAGPLVNFLFAIVAFFAIALMPAEGVKPILGDLPADSIIAQQGVVSGARLSSVDGRQYRHFREHDLYILNQVLKGEDLIFGINQGGKELTVEVSAADVPIYKLSTRTLARKLGLMPVLPPITTTLKQVVKKSAAADAGLLPGDKILKIGDQSIGEWADLISIVSRSAEIELSVMYEREGVQNTLLITPSLIESNGQRVGLLGVSPVIEKYQAHQTLTLQRSLLESVQYGFEQTWLMSSTTARMLWKMLALKVSHENISGPITIAQVSGEAIQVGLDYYLQILAVISISLGIMNLLPIPMLDGGHLLMYLIEAVAGKQVAEKTFVVGQKLGILLLAALMSLAFYNDIFRLMN